ncbi:AT-rich interactive domain-containing protein 2 [Argentina anserina]|uniref:AT-rich interactive domain-containing protein 2 n=1 Tax=Argentina anserina TaxID=57926 RepID=UPI0021766420|nr:AT-rich interactive domain-containing protein 2 [Potentilla anserina]
MAEWSFLTNGSVLDLADVIDANPINGDSLDSVIESVKDDDEGDHKCTDIDTVQDGVECVSDDYKGRLRCTFDQVMSAFLKEIGGRGIVRPVPAVFGDRQNVDLFKLFCVVRDKGGYDLVSKKRLWSFVSKELSLDSGATAACVKLIYFKYLNELEIWFRESCMSRGLGNRKSGKYGTFHLLSLELETEFRGMLLDGTEQKDNGDDLLLLEPSQNGKSECSFSDTKEACAMHSGTGTCNGGKDENVCNDHQYGTLTVPSSVNSKENDRKRKRRESLSGMLNWVIQTARQVGDISNREIPESAKWRTHQGNEFWFHAIKARDALMLRRDINPKTEELLQQKKLRMHPFMYEDYIRAGHHSSERLRCRGRLPHSTKSRSCTCCNSSPPTQSNLSSPPVVLHNGSKGQEPMEVDSASPHPVVVPSDEDESREKYVSVGSLFQADVPEWTGVASESDSKWLGTRVWPLQSEENTSFVETDIIGQGRPDFCGCRLSGSVTCLRFHIAEARIKLRKELSSLFYHWRFDRMDEEISLQWTAEEEKRFKTLVQSKYPLFWNSASKWFPRKTRENLVSYYFNVFLVQRRSYQNRATPKNIDSDDDETDFGSLSEGFGHEAVKVPGSSVIACSQNKQCVDLD